MVATGAPPKLFRREGFIWPDIEDLGSAVRKRVDRIESLLRENPLSFVVDGPLDWLPGVESSLWVSLQHELSWAFGDTWPGRHDLDDHSLREIHAAGLWCAEGERALRHRDAGRLEIALDTFTGTVTRMSCPRRTSERVGTSENQGAAIVFVPAREAALRLSSICQHVTVARPDSPLLLAVTALVALNNCHPYMDGNGRASRWLFNLILACNGLISDSYLPLNEFFIRSRGGFLIRQRAAEIHAKWDDLLAYFLTIIEHLNNHRGPCL